MFCIVWTIIGKSIKRDLGLEITIQITKQKLYSHRPPSLLCQKAAKIRPLWNHNTMTSFYLGIKTDQFGAYCENLLSYPCESAFMLQFFHLVMKGKNSVLKLPYLFSCCWHNTKVHSYWYAFTHTKVIQIILTLLLLNTTCPVLANSVAPDQLASSDINRRHLQKPTDLDLHCLSLNIWISIKNPDQLIWLAGN